MLFLFKSVFFFVNVSIFLNLLLKNGGRKNAVVHYKKKDYSTTFLVKVRFCVGSRFLYVQKEGCEIHKIVIFQCISSKVFSIL